MRSDQDRFWDERFKHEGTIWGEGPSATATTAVCYLPPKARVLEIGFGYGRDLVFMLRQGYRVCGVDFSTEARHRAELRLHREGLTAERLVTSSFEDSDFPDESFDAVISHRMVHLLTTSEAVERFAEIAWRILRPGGILCLGVRNAEDLNPSRVRPWGQDVYEYTPRAGHLIRFWDDRALQQAFGRSFTLLAFDRVSEKESATYPIPCHLTVMVAGKIDPVDEVDERISRDEP
jgi:SAM-dependent methyltransferase